MSTPALRLITSVALILLVLASAGCEPKRRPARVDDGTPRVRVRLLAGVSQVTLTGDRATPILDASTRRPLEAELPAGQPLTLAYDGKNWQAGGETLPGVALRIEPDADGIVSVNGQPYRGAYTLLPTSEGRIDVVNDVDVEAYLQGVLAKELLPDWHPEAYRAQAVIARTYALYEARTNPAGRGWDLNPDERSQVYGGVKAETPKANAAVSGTRGLVAAHGPSGQERIFKAYFSACCGGISSSAADVFNDPAIAPLSAKSNGTVCSISPRFNWPAVMLSKAELARRFRAWGGKTNRPEAKLPGVQSIEIGATNPFGRPRTYLLTDTRGQQYALTAEQLRWAINSDPAGGPTVFSGFFRPVDAGDNIRFADGHGFGHGVGACQWCMQARALAGESFQQIVTQAYPQSMLVAAF
ncbi:MAG TPA: SpoIID/LytB domain-containing protein [Tepidisphaeraceae bacterium]